MKRERVEGTAGMAEISWFLSKISTEILGMRNGFSFLFEVVELNASLQSRRESCRQLASTIPILLLILSTYDAKLEKPARLSESTTSWTFSTAQRNFWRSYSTISMTPSATSMASHARRRISTLSSNRETSSFNTATQLTKSLLFHHMRRFAVILNHQLQHQMPP